MKKTINAYIYPTPTEFDRQMEERRCSELLARTNHASCVGQLIQRAITADLMEGQPPFDEGMLRAAAEYTGYDPRQHISPDDTEAYFPPDMTDVERIVRDEFAAALGIPKEAIIVSQFRDKVKNADRFIPASPNEFVWRSHDGKQYNVSEMATPHVLYSLRMIFNHTVPPAFRVLRPGEKMKRYGDVAHWDEDYRRAAVDAFVAALEKRSDLDGIFKDQYEDMRANATALNRLGILP
jgi:hypothetical protein